MPREATHFHLHNLTIKCGNFLNVPVADPGGAEGAMAPPGPVKIGHKKDGHRRQPHRFHVSRSPLTRPLDPLLRSVVV